MPEITRTENDSIIDFATKAAAATTLTLEGPDGSQGLAVVIPQGQKLQSVKAVLDEFRTEPERKTGTARFHDLASFIAHVNRFKDPDSALFADPNPRGPSLTSVLDYHHAGDRPPRFGTHRGVYPFPLSEEWQKWIAKDGETMSQAEFAEFVENRIHDVVAPATAGETAKLFVESLGCHFAPTSKLLELSRGLSMRVEQKVANSQVLQTGEVSMQFTTTHVDEQGAPLKVPGAMLLAIPVFRNGAIYQVPARIRYRQREGRISWFYELHGVDRVIDHAVKEACDLAVKETALPLFFGSPE